MEFIVVVIFGGMALLAAWYVLLGATVVVRAISNVLRGKRWNS